MYFVRTPCEWGMDAISATLTFLWEVVGYVEGLFFKDLKQTMKKEQCEVKLLVTASMPGKLPVPAQSISCFSLFVNRVKVERALRLMVNSCCCVCVDAGTKTLVVHGQNECDIPTQLPVHEDTQFEALLKVRKDFLASATTLECSIHRQILFVLLRYSGCIFRLFCRTVAFYFEVNLFLLPCLALILLENIEMTII